MAAAFKRLQLARDIVAAGLVPTLVKRNHADLVSRHKVNVALAVVKREGEDARKAFYHRRKIAVVAKFFVKRNDDFAIASRPKIVGAVELRADFLVVVNFSVGREDDFLVVAYKRLLSAKGVHDAKALVAKNRVWASVNAAPVRAAVTNFF